MKVFNTEVTMTIKELMTFKAFQRTVAETCNRIPFMRNSRAEWEIYLDELMMMVLEEENAPEEASPSGLIWEHAKDFLRHEIPEDRFVEGGYGPLRNETDFYIRGIRLLQYLRVEMGNIPGPTIWATLRQRGASTDKKWFKDADEKWVQRRVWILPINLVERPVELEGLESLQY